MGDEAVVEKLFAVFAATDAKGAALYPVEDLRHFLPWVLIHLPIDFSALDDATVQIFADTCSKAGVTGNEDLSDKLARYYEDSPPNPALVAALGNAWREVNAGGGGAANPFAKFSGGAAAHKVLDSGGKRPEGTVPAGPMARFQVDPKKK